MTDYRCKNCLKAEVNGSTAVPMFCGTCATRLGRCGQCGNAPKNLDKFSPSLADVLAALGKEHGIRYGITADGTFLENRRGIYDWAGIPSWKMDAPLSAQPDATVSALYGITSGKGNE